MNKRAWARTVRLAGLWIFLLLGTNARATATVSLLPESTSVAVGADFDLQISIDDGIDTFSNFQVIFRFDPTLVEFVEAFEGSLYTSSGYQSFFDAEEESLGTWQVFEVIFPYSSFVRAPGEMARLRFHAAAAGLSEVRILSAAVMDIDRQPIEPVVTADARIFGGDLVAVESGESGRPPWGLSRPAPNPAREGTRIRFALPPGIAPSSCRLALYDARGRLVRLWNAPRSSFSGEIDWDGRDERGRPVPPAVYFFRLETPDATAGRKVIFLR